MAQYGPYAEAVRVAEGVTRPAPDPLTETGHLNPYYSEWMMGIPRGWVCEVPGLSNATKLKMLGNGVAPLQAELGIRMLVDILKGVINDCT